MKISKGLLDLTTTQTGLAQALGISQQRVSQLIQDGVIIKAPTGAVRVVESIKNYYKRQAAVTEGESLDLTKERARHEQVKRELAEIELAKRRNEVHEAKDVELVMTDMLVNLRSQLLAVPAKMAPFLVDKTKDQISELLAKEIQDRLTELSDYRPDMFSEVEESAEDSSAAEDD